MHNYNEILILHPLDDSTSFLEPFKEYFPNYYHSFDSSLQAIQAAKAKLGDLESKCLVIFIGHGSSFGLYEPSVQSEHEKYFLDVQWGNHYFDQHDVLLLCCRSNKYIEKMYHASSLIGFGNIISSSKELEIHNESASTKKLLTENEISLFKSYFIRAIVDSIKLLESGKITFHQLPNYISFIINKHIVSTLKDKSNNNRIELAKLLFEFRNEIAYKSN